MSKKQRQYRAKCIRDNALKQVIQKRIALNFLPHKCTNYEKKAALKKYRRWHHQNKHLNRTAGSNHIIGPMDKIASPPHGEPGELRSPRWEKLRRRKTQELGQKGKMFRRHDRGFRSVASLERRLTRRKQNKINGRNLRRKLNTQLPHWYLKSSFSGHRSDTKEDSKDKQEVQDQSVKIRNRSYNNLKATNLQIKALKRQLKGPGKFSSRMKSFFYEKPEH